MLSLIRSYRIRQDPSQARPIAVTSEAFAQAEMVHHAIAKFEGRRPYGGTL